MKLCDSNFGLGGNASEATEYMSRLTRLLTSDVLRRTVNAGQPALSAPAGKTFIPISPYL
jgi:hypothetical protein